MRRHTAAANHRWQLGGYEGIATPFPEKPKRM